MSQEIISILVGWILGLITALIAQRNDHRLQIKRLETQIKLQREESLRMAAQEWNQKEFLAKLGKTMVDTNYPKLSSMLSLPKRTILVIAGSDKDKRFTIQGLPVTIGSAEKCSIRLQDSKVSKYHARIIIADDVFVLEAISSESPVWLNNNELTLPSVLNENDKIRLGSTILEFLP